MDKALTLLGRAGVALGVASTVPYFCLYNVDGGEKAVMFNRFNGVSDTATSEGSHFMVPWLHIPYIYDIKTRPKIITTTTGTKDLQTVSISLRLLFKPEPSQLPRIHKTLGPDYEDRVLPSIGNEILKATVARFDAESLLTQRDKVSHDIRDAITKRAQQFDIILEDVAITHLQYGREFSRAIEEKQVAQQEAERTKFLVQKSEQEKIASIVRAGAEAEAADMISKSLKEHGSGVIDVRRIDSLREIAETVSKSPNVMYVPQSQNILLNVNQPSAPQRQ